MNHDKPQNSLHNLAQIAHMSQELHALNELLRHEELQLKNSESETSRGGMGENADGLPDGNGNGSDFGGAVSDGINGNGGVGSGVPSTKAGKPKRMACVECRQQKSKCDAHEKYPNSCTRCTKKGLRCNLRSDYKRTYKRARISQIEKEFSELKKSLTAAETSELLKKLPSLYRVRNELDEDDSHMFNDISFNEKPEDMKPHSSGETNPSTLPSIPNTPSVNRSNDLNKLAPDIGSVKIPEHVLYCEEKTLDSITIKPDIIATLYLEYVNHYHPILPVVDVMKGPEAIYRLCPALFWVMMFVSLRRVHDENSRDLLLQLSPAIKDVLAEITISPITRYNPTEEDEPILNACSVYSVQAFLIYTFWPPITSSLSADTSWNTIGLALFHAIRIGLNSPSPAMWDDRDNKTSQQVSMAHEQTKTWIICNIASQTIASVFGFPAFVQFDSSIWASLRNSSPMKIPKSIKFMLEIASFEDQTAKTLNSNPMDPYGLIDPTERLPLLKVLSRQLDELEIKLAEELPGNDSHRKFQLLVARVHLLTYYFMDSSRIAFFELQKGLVRLYNAAVALIDFAQHCQARDKNFIKYLPGVYVLSIWQASCIIAKLGHSPLKKYIDLGSGKQTYQAAISLAAKASILRHDMAHRSSGIMRNMWQVLRSLDEKKQSTLTIGIRTRMAASVFFDCLYVLRDQVGMLKLNSRHENETLEGEEAASNEDEDEEYGYQDNEEAVGSEDEKEPAGDNHHQDESQKSTPSSNTSSKTKKTRSLSSTVNAESKARKIIRTIPLDPQPISVNKKRSNIFKMVDSNESSPSMKPNDKFKIDTGYASSPPPLFTNAPGKMAITGNTINRSQANYKQHESHEFNSPQSNSSNPEYQRGSTQQHHQQQEQQLQPQQLPQAQDSYKYSFNQPQEYRDPTDQTAPSSRNNLSLQQHMVNESPQRGLENLEMDILDINSDVLWKDVDSVMNDFGFHAH